MTTVLLQHVFSRKRNWSNTHFIKTSQKEKFMESRRRASTCCVFFRSLSHTRCLLAWLGLCLEKTSFVWTLPTLGFMSIKSSCSYSSSPKSGVSLQSVFILYGECTVLIKLITDKCAWGSLESTFLISMKTCSASVLGKLGLMIKRKHFILRCSWVHQQRRCGRPMLKQRCWWELKCSGLWTCTELLPCIAWNKLILSFLNLLSHLLFLKNRFNSRNENRPRNRFVRTWNRRKRRIRRTG